MEGNSITVTVNIDIPDDWDDNKKELRKRQIARSITHAARSWSPEALVESDDEYVLIYEAGWGDFYAGQHAALYHGGSLIWEGYSDDSIGDILLALGVTYKVRKAPYSGKSPLHIETESNDA